MKTAATLAAICAIALLLRVLWRDRHQRLHPHDSGTSAPSHRQSLMKRRALVIVLGDLDRSPRMRLHSASLAATDWSVETVAFGPATRSIPAFDWLRSRRAFWLFALLRQIALAASLCLALTTVRRPDVVLLANPPTLPALPVVLLFNTMWRARLIVDWHNLTAAML